MGGDGTMSEHDQLRGIDSAGDQRGGHLAHVRSKLIGVDVDRQRMEVGEEIEAFCLVLHPDPAQNRSEEVAKVQTACRLDAGDNADCGFGHASLARRFSNSFTSSSTNAPVKKQAAA